MGGPLPRFTLDVFGQAERRLLRVEGPFYRAFRVQHVLAGGADTRLFCSFPPFALRLALKPFNLQSLISHLTNSNGCGNLRTKVLLTVSPFGPFLFSATPCVFATVRFLSLLPAEASLCFHNLTNPFSRNPFIFTSIQNPRGCGGYSVRLFTSRRSRGTSHALSMACRLLFSLGSLFRIPFLCFQQL